MMTRSFSGCDQHNLTRCSILQNGRGGYFLATRLFWLLSCLTVPHVRASPCLTVVVGGWRLARCGGHACQLRCRCLWGVGCLVAQPCRCSRFNNSCSTRSARATWQREELHGEPTRTRTGPGRLRALRRAHAKHESTRRRRREPPPRLQARWRRSQASGRGSNLPNTKSQPRTRTDPICYTNLPTSRVASPVTENFL